MDVAKYIGLFLLKNNFVYIHGLGNLELRKKSASFDGAALKGPSFEVVLTPLGSIDDNLANFIATNEQISISKAANALREFSSQARAEMQSGKAVVIPSIGSFQEANGKITFHTDPNLQYTPPSIPTTRIAKPQEEKVYTTNADIPAVKPRYIDPEVMEEERSLSWMKIGVWAVLFFVIAGGIYFGAQYLNKQDQMDEASMIQIPVQDTVQQNIALADSSIMVVDSMPSVATTSNDVLNLQVILHTYTDRVKAQRKESQLTSYGHNVRLVVDANDSAISYVVLTLGNIPTADTTHILDSLTKFFNPTRGVRVLEQ